MQFTVVMIQRLFLIFHLHNITIRKSAYKDSNIDSDSDILRVLSEASSVSSYQLRKKGTTMKNIERRNDVFDSQKLEDYFKISKNYKKYGTSDRVKRIAHQNR